FLFYIYPFSWTLAGGILGLLLAIGLIKKDFGGTKNILKIILLGLVVAAPYWINFFNLLNHSLYETVKERQVLLPSRFPVFSTLLFLDLILCGVYFWYTKNRSLFWFLITPVLALWILINQQIITGYRLFPGHWHWYYIVPFSILLALVVVFELFKKQKIIKIALFTVIALAALSNGVLSQKTFYHTKNQNEFATLQRYAEVFGWLNESAPRGSVVLANDFFSTWLPVYTTHFRYAFLRTDELYLIPDERIKHTFFVKLRLFGATRENIENFINANTAELDTILSGYYRRYSENCHRCYTKEEISALQQEYLEFFNSDFAQAIKKYEANFIMEDTKNDAMVDLAKDEAFELLKEIEGIKIYRIN
ncbi:MAG: hypothetical protein HY397_01210, partial [Candidatus Doudnabacteria bacterium]|nr:hypothetical protein [Candidatus Doudnabacteria bacterium]